MINDYYCTSKATEAINAPSQVAKAIEAKKQLNSAAKATEAIDAPLQAAKAIATKQ